MATKNFKDKKPLDTVGGKLEKKLEPDTVEVLPQKNENIFKSQKKKKNNDYLRLDIANYREYLSTMAGFKRVSITKYIQRLIDKDMEQYDETYKKLKSIQDE